MNVKELRSKLGISQSAFAEQIGVDYHAVMSWEKGKRKPSPMAKKSIQRVFKVKID